MKRTPFIAGLLCLLAFSASAQIPEKITWQGYLTDPAGEPINGSVNLILRLYDAGTGGTVKYEKDTTGVLADHGVVNVPLGPLPWTAHGAPLFLGIRVNGGAELTPRSPWTSVPYALAIRGVFPATRGQYSGQNIILGPNNTVVEGVVGGTVSGGGGLMGSTPVSNAVGGDWATVGGGLQNGASNTAATVAGGYDNSATAYSATVAGGHTNAANGYASAVGGGESNAVAGDMAAVAGGSSNAAGGYASVIGGGMGNSSGGGRSTVGGGSSNRADALWSTVGGGDRNRATEQHATVGGGILNKATGAYATVAGGYVGTASGTYAAIPGGIFNQARGEYSLAAGAYARAKHAGTFVFNDSPVSEDSLVSTGPDQFLIRAGGGVGIGTNAPSNQLSVVGDIDFNGRVGIGTTTPAAALSIDGPDDLAAGPVILLGGKALNQVESGRIRFVENEASNGFRGTYIHYHGVDNRLYIGDHPAPDELTATDVNILSIERGTGHVGVGRNDPAYPLHVGTDGTNGNGAHVTNGGVWTNGSSRAFKEGFEPVDAEAVLARVAALPISRWRYKGGEEAEHMGPVAEDFHEAFGLGSDERYIGTVDADGVSLAAIQGLVRRLERAEKRNEELEARLAELEGLVAAGRGVVR